MDHSKLDPDSAFPPEVIELKRRGVPLPTWFAGPLYTGNGPLEAVNRLHAAREHADDEHHLRDDEPAAF